MRLVTFASETVFGPARRLGALIENGNRVIDLQIAYIASLIENRVDLREATKIASVTMPSQMEAFITGGRASLEAARQALELASRINLNELRGPGGHPGSFRLGEIRLHAPIGAPNSIRDFLAFEDHAAAGARRRGEELNPLWYQRPIYYKANHRSIVGPDEPVPRPRFTRELDFEMEVACVLGSSGKNLTSDEAARVIFGFTVMNDWSARDIQKTEMSTRLGPAKSKDFATSLGPCIVTADEVGTQPNLAMTARINGQMVCQANLGNAHWTFQKMIEFVSDDESVWATDVYGSGTPYGGCLLDTGGPWLEPGDVVELEVEHIGLLRNAVV